MADDDEDADEFPRWFGDYVLLKALGHGGMGQVYLARLPGLQGIERLCVIKTLKKQWTRDREYVARFVDEARVVVQLAHRNICTVFDVGAVAGTYYLAMDLVPGRDLQSVLARAHKKAVTIPVDVALGVAVEIVDALDAAHRLIDPETDEPVGLVHRDVSPHNVLVSFDGEVKLIDFGLATSSWKNERTEPGVVLGKLAYMAPEHARGDVVDRRADLFATGVVLYELIAGQLPFGAESVHMMLRQHAYEAPRPLPAHVPAKVQALFERLLEKDPERRIQSAAEVRVELLDLLDGEVVTGVGRRRPRRGRAARPGRAARRCRRPRRATAGPAAAPRAWPRPRRSGRRRGRRWPAR
jgi:serine/threonine-protein kinase